MAAELRTLQGQARQRGNLGESLFVRLALALEELAEWLEAHANGDLVAAADAKGDRLYMMLGDAVSAGMPGAAIFKEIHRSNMTKAAQLAKPDGKAFKQGTYARPRLAAAQIWRRKFDQCGRQPVRAWRIGVVWLGFGRLQESRRQSWMHEQAD